MVLQRLQLTNFRGFESLDLSFEPDLTVLVGVNGCGKTSVLDALATGLNLRVLQPRDVRSGTRSVTIRTSIADQPISSLTGELLNTDGSGIGTSTSGRPVLPFLLMFYGVNREATDETPGSTQPSKWDTSQATLFAPSGVRYRDFFQWFREMEDDENERIRYDEGAENPLLRAVRSAARRLLPGYSNLRIRRSGAMGDSRPRLTLEKNGEVFLFDVLSEGERTILAMVGW